MVPSIPTSSLYANGSSIVQIQASFRPFAHGSIMTSLPVIAIKQWMPCSVGRKKKTWNCKAHMLDHGYDLYELLGVENTASERDIRRSYRWLQKKCHPDVVGAVGHDMSILLNEAYSTLSHPERRAAYDQLRGTLAEFEGFTGQPLYSKWFGPADESRAIFVDESRCIGCLKCALIASNTFAIETRYGRARAVGQWADPEPAIEDAIKACPVDCISWVDRNKLAALEFVMSKQPRVHVGISVHSNGGIRIIDVHGAADRFLEKKRLKEEEYAFRFQETPAQRNARLSAMQAIQTRAGKWWHHFVGKKMEDENENSNISHASQGAIVPWCYFKTASRGLNAMNSSDSSAAVDGVHEKYESHFLDELGPLFEAAAQWRCSSNTIYSGGPAMEEYWVPLEPISRSVSLSSEETASIPRQERMTKHSYTRGSTESSSINGNISMSVKGILSKLPVLASAVAAMFVGFTGGTDSALSDTETMGPLPLELTNSLGMQVFLAAAVWYIIGTALGYFVVMALSLHNLPIDNEKHTS